MNKDQIWQAVLGEIELSVSRPNFTTWFRNTSIVEFQAQTVIIGVPSAFAKAWLENKYRSSILQALQHITGQPVTQLSYRIIQVMATENTLHTPTTPKSIPSSSYTPATPTSTATQHPQQISTNLNPKYVFESFVVGKTNELAQAACMAVADRPGQVYNPLFIYGGVGLGKTHLMQAIGNRILSRDENKRILYVSCETFTNEFISAIREGKGREFKNKYRSVDVLLVDDVQFISGKEQTQEEFFHTFNHLHQLNKQIVVSSDRAPKAIGLTEGRLLSRFEWGMVVDVGAPDLETRIAILAEKCQQHAVQLPQEVLTYIATHIQHNIRELEGALNRVIAMQRLKNIPVTTENVTDILGSLVQTEQTPTVTSSSILRAVAEFFDLKPEDLVGNSRKKSLVTARQIVMYLMRSELKSSYPDIGQALGGRDHTTAMYACEKVNIALKTDQQTRQHIQTLRERLHP